jgi:hypothetical protein
MAEAKITISAQDLASGVMDVVNQKLREMGAATEDAKPHVETFGESIEKLGHSFALRVAEGELLRDAFHEVFNVVREGIAAFPELVMHTIEVGNKLFEMSLKTGASVENLSALRYVASQTGLDFDSFGTTLFKMEQALGASGAKADEMQKHLDTLGLDLRTLKNEKPDQAFIDIMSALEAVPNRADQAAAGMAIFGRGFKEMAGLTQESITDLMAEAHDLGLVMSTDTAAAAHAAEVGFKGFSMQLEAVGMQVAATVTPALVAVTKLIGQEFHDGVERAGHPVIDLKQTVEDVTMKMLDWSTAGINTAQFLDHAFEGTKAMLFDVEAKVVGVASAFMGFIATANEVASHIPGFGDKFKAMGESVRDAQRWVDGFQQGLKAESEGALDAAAKHDQLFNGLAAGVADMKTHFHDAFGKAGEEINHFADMSHNAYGGIGADVEGSTKGIQALQKQQEEWLKTLGDLTSAGASWKDTLDGIDGETLAAVEYYLAAGVSQSELAKAYGLTEIQVKAVKSAMDDYKRTIEDVHRVEQSKNADSLKALETLGAAQQKATQKQFEDTVKSVNETEKLWDDYYFDIATASMSTVDKQKAQVQRWFDDEVAKLRDDDLNWQEHYEALYVRAHQKMDDITRLNDPFYKAQKQLQDDLAHEWDHFLADVYGGFSKTFSVDIVKALDGGGGFHEVWKDLWHQLKDDVDRVLADLLNNVIQGFISGAEAKLGGFLAGLALKGGAGGGGLWGLIAGALGHGGDSSGNVPGGGPGYFDPNTGVWITPGTGGGLASDEDPRHDAEGGLIGPRYLAAGGSVFPGKPEGVDTVPVWAQQGEGMLNVRAMRNLGEPMLNHLNRGGEVLNTRVLEDKLDALHAATVDHKETMERAMMMMPIMLRHAMRGTS